MSRPAWKYLFSENQRVKRRREISFPVSTDCEIKLSSGEIVDRWWPIVHDGGTVSRPGEIRAYNSQDLKVWTRSSSSTLFFPPAMFGEDGATRTPDRNHPVESARHHHARLGLWLVWKRYLAFTFHWTRKSFHSAVGKRFNDIGRRKSFFFFPFSFFWRLSNSSDNFCVVVLKFGLTELLYPSRLILFSPFPNGNQILLATDFNLTGFSNAIG